MMGHVTYVVMNIYVLLLLYIIKTHSCVSAANEKRKHEKENEHTHQCVIYATSQVVDFSLS